MNEWIYYSVILSEGTLLYEYWKQYYNECGHDLFVCEWLIVIG